MGLQSLTQPLSNCQSPASQLASQRVNVLDVCD
jgi:hypothetical protein